MADPVQPIHRLTHDKEHFDLADLWSDEMAQVKSWTGFSNRQEFYQALQNEDADAVVAAFSLVKWRAENKVPRWSEVRVNMNALAWSRIVGDREVAVLLEERDGKPLVVQVDKNNEPIKDAKGGYLDPTGADDERVGFALLKTDEGYLRWKFTDTGEEVRPTTEPTSGQNDSPSTAKKRSSSASGSGTGATEAA